MRSRMQNLAQPEGGPRYVMTGDYKGAQITVVCGYVAVEDCWAYHVRVKRTGGPEQRLGEPSQLRASNQNEANDKGFSAGIEFLDAHQGFQRVVK